MELISLEKREAVLYILFYHYPFQQLHQELPLKINKFHLTSWTEVSYFPYNHLIPTCETCKQNITLRVPYGKVAAYKATDGWKDFFHFEEMPPKKGDVNDDDSVDENDISELAKEIIEPSQEYDATKDVNGDGYINVTDIVELVNIMK